MGWEPLVYRGVSSLMIITGKKKKKTSKKSVCLYRILQNDFCYIYLCVCLHVCVFSHVQLFAMPWTVARQASLSMGFSRQEYWSGLPCPPPGDLPDPGTEHKSPGSPALQTDSFLFGQWGSSPILPPSFIFTLSQVHPLCFLHLFLSILRPILLYASRPQIPFLWQAEAVSV